MPTGPVIGPTGGRSKVRRPRVGLLSADAGDGERLQAGLSGSGFLVEKLETMRQVRRAVRKEMVAAFIDLAHPEADAAIKTLSDGGVRVVAFDAVVSDLTLVRSRVLGAADAVSRARLLKTPQKWLPRVL